jgi:hypothetical protein
MEPNRNILHQFAEWAAGTPMFRAGTSAQQRAVDVSMLHRPPRIPVMIDDVESDARAVRDFNGQPLITVYDGDAEARRMLHIFSTRTMAADYVEAAESPIGGLASQGSRPQRASNSRIRSARQALTAGPPPNGGVYEMYDLDDLGGCYWRILEWEGLTFNYSTKFACGFLWWGWISADGNVSSIDSYVSADHVFLWALPNLSGSLLWVPTGAFRINRLSDLGWDNRISSQNVLYF